MMILQGPAYSRIKIGKSVEIEDILERGQHVLQEALALQDLHERLHQEGKLFHLLATIRHAQLRHDKSMQLLGRVKACMQRVHIMNRLFVLVSDLLKDIEVCLTSEGDQMYTPCRQSWSYLLYLIFQYNELLQRTISYAITTFQYLTCAFTIGHLLRTITMHMTITASVWQLCTSLSHKLSKVYEGLYSLQSCWEASKSDWVCPHLPKKLSVDAGLTDLTESIERSMKDFLKESHSEESSVLEESKLTESGSLSAAESMEEDSGDVQVRSKSKVMKRKLDDSLPEDKISPRQKKKKTRDVKEDSVIDLQAGSEKGKKKKKKKDISNRDSDNKVRKIETDCDDAINVQNPLSSISNEQTDVEIKETTNSPVYRIEKLVQRNGSCDNQKKKEKKSSEGCNCTKEQDIVIKEKNKLTNNANSMAVNFACAKDMREKKREIKMKKKKRKNLESEKLCLFSLDSTKLPKRLINDNDVISTTGLVKTNESGTSESKNNKNDCTANECIDIDIPIHMNSQKQKAVKRKKNRKKKKKVL